MTKQEKIIYLAGIVDGEGHFCRPRMKKKDRKRTYYYPRLIVVQKHKPLIAWLKKNFGGGMYYQKESKSGKTGLWRWTLAGKGVTELANEVLPYLIVKKEQVKIVL